MVRKGDWKQVEYLGYGHPQLFNLVDDPDEQNDLGQNPEYADLISDLSKEIAVHWDGERVKRNYERQQKHQNMLKDWYQNTKIGLEEKSGL